MPALIRPYPYAAKAYVQHEFDVDHLNVWLTFRHPMDQTVKPAHNLWTCEVDTVNKAVTASAWQSEFTLLLTVGAVGAFPDRVLLSYDGPSADLQTTWEKQWEPWTEILSVSVPYGWEGVIFIDIVNKRVGIAGPPTTGTFEIISLDGSNRIIIYHDNTNAYFKTDDGTFIFESIEGEAIITRIEIRGYRGALRVYDGANFGQFQQAGTTTTFFSPGVFQVNAAGNIWLAQLASADVTNFIQATEGETRTFRVYGFRAGDQQRNLGIDVGGAFSAAPDTVGFGGLSNYRFVGSVISARFVSGTLTHSILGPTDDLDVSGVNIVFLDCSVNDVIIGAFVGGVAGQKLSIARLCAAANNATLEHNEGTVNQNIFLHKGLDETLTGEYGGWELICDGTSWFDTSHSKHV